MKLQLITTSGKNSTTTVADAVFGVTPNQQLLAQAVRVYLANQRQGTSYTKVRSDVIRSKSKWYRQKGTGNARHGSKNAHIFVGGGVAHGPRGNQNWDLALTKRMKKQALTSALSLQAENTYVSDELPTVKKTKEAQTLLNTVKADARKVLVIMADVKPTIVRNYRNIPKVLVVTATQVTAYEILVADVIVITTEAVKRLEERLSTVSSKAQATAKAKSPVTTTTKKTTTDKSMTANSKTTNSAPAKKTTTAKTTSSKTSTKKTTKKMTARTTSKSAAKTAKK